MRKKVLIYNVSHPTNSSTTRHYMHVLDDIGVDYKVILNKESDDIVADYYVPVLWYKRKKSIELMSEIVIRENPDYILGLEEPVLPIVAEINEKFGLPGYTTRITNVTCSKDEWAKFCRRVGIGIPDHKIITTLRELEVDYDFILKPDWGNGSTHIIKSTTGIIDDSIFDYDQDFLGSLLCQKLLSSDSIHLSINFFCNDKEVYFTNLGARLVNKHGIGIRTMSGETEHNKKYFDVGKEYIRKALRALKATNVQGAGEMMVENGKVYWFDPNFRTSPFSHLMLIKEHGIDHAKESMKSFLDSNYTPKIEFNERYVSSVAIDSSYKWSGLSNETSKILAPNIKLVDSHNGKWIDGHTLGMQPKRLLTSGSSLEDSERLLDSYLKTLEYDILR